MYKKKSKAEHVTTIEWKKRKLGGFFFFLEKPR